MVGTIISKYTVCLDLDSNDDGKCVFMNLHAMETSILKTHLAGKQIVK